MGFFTGISNKFISGYADAFFVYYSVPVCFLYRKHWIIWRLERHPFCVPVNRLQQWYLAFSFLGQYRIILSTDTASEVRQMLSQKRR